MRQCCPSLEAVADFALTPDTECVLERVMSLALVQAGVGSALHIGVKQPVDDEERSNEEGAFDPSDFAESEGQFVLAGIGCELSQQLAGRKGAADQGGSNPQDVRPSSAPLSVDPGRCDIVGKGRVRRTARPSPRPPPDQHQQRLI